MSKLIRRKQLELDITSSPENDGLYGFSNSTSGIPVNVADIVEGITLEDALNRIAIILDKVSPAPPPNLNRLSLTLTATTTNVSGYLTIDGNLYTNIYQFLNNASLTWTTTGVPNPPNVSTSNGYFSDATSTTAKLRMTHTYNGVTKQTVISNINLISQLDGTATSINGSNGYNIELDILDKRDFYALDPSASTKSNFYYAIKADMKAFIELTYNAGDIYQRTVSMDYSELGDFSDTLSLTGSYRVESNATPTTTTPTLSFGSMTGLVSGVPTHLAGDVINITSTITNSIKSYFPNQIGISSVQGTSNQNNLISGIKTPNSAYSYSAYHILLTNQYLESITGSVTPYDIFGTGTLVNSATNTTNRIDTVSIVKLNNDASIRVLSPVTGTQFEAISTSPYNSTAHTNSLNPSSTSVYSYQLQLLDGIYRYPSVNYSNYGGPNYSSLLQNSWRYCDFLGVLTITNRTNVTVTINGATGINQIYGTPNFRLYLQISGVTGWLDCNAAWSAGSPHNNGDAAVNVSSSTSNTSRNITFGATLSGSINIRLGINSGSTITFTSITVS